jgi:hypothetical protein
MEIKKAMKFEVASMDELVRMAFFSAGRNHGLNFLFFQHPDKKTWVMGFLTGVPAYFEYRGIPMFFYATMKEKPDPHNFVSYSSKEVKEKWSFVKATTEPTKWNYLPVIALKDVPPFF